MPPKTTPPPEPSLEVFGESVRRGIEGIGRRFSAPDDDWIPGLLHIETKTHAYEVYALDGTMFQPGLKDATFATLAALLKEREAVRYGLLTNGWMIDAGAVREDESREEAGARLMAQAGEWLDHFAEHPQRIEVLAVELVDRERAEHWQARIVRHEQEPPTLTPWERFDGEVGGRVGWLREALQEEADDEQGR